MTQNFITAFSEKNGEDAIKEIVLKLRVAGVDHVNHILIFFTPHYQPITILRVLNSTLKPGSITGLEAPALIHEDTSISKGIVACCINKPGAVLKNISIKNASSTEIELSMRKLFHEFSGEKSFLFASIPTGFSYSETLSGLKISFGKTFNMHGWGYVKKFSPKIFNIVNKGVEEGLACLIGGGLNVESYKISGFLPIGRTFTITKVLGKSNVITEINNQPAINIYKKYLEEKFDAFKQRRLFPVYPLRVKEDTRSRLVSVLDCLEDGSLVCMEEIKEGSKASLTLLHPPLLFETLASSLEPLKNIAEPGLIFVVNSFIRKKVLKDGAGRELQIIREQLGKNHKMIGLYADYFFSPDKDTQEANLENGPLLMSIWR